MSPAHSSHALPLPRFDQSLESGAQANVKVVYWHRELPPLDAKYMGEHIVEATSARVTNTLAHPDDLWDRCYGDLMARACDRLEQEVVRLGGSYAHVLDESVDSCHDDVTNERWLHGSFTYMLYRSTKPRTIQMGT